MDKGIDPNLRPEKQVIKPIITPQTCILPETKIYLILNQEQVVVDQV